MTRFWWLRMRRRTPPRGRSGPVSARVSCPARRPWSSTIKSTTAPSPSSPAHHCIIMFERICYIVRSKHLTHLLLAPVFCIYSRDSLYFREVIRAPLCWGCPLWLPDTWGGGKWPFIQMFSTVLPRKQSRPFLCREAEQLRLRLLAYCTVKEHNA